MTDTAPPTSAPTTLANRAGRSARWAVLQSGGKHVIDLAVFLILAKLLTPEAFGLVAMAGAVIVLINVLAEMGLGDAIVQRAELHSGHLDAAFWATVGLGLVLGGLVWVLAPWIVRLFGQPELSPVLRALAPLFLIQTLNVVPQALLQREFGFRQLALRALVGSVAGGVAGVTLALYDGGAWSLVTQQLVSGGVGLVGLWRFCRWRPRWRFSRPHALELLAFSRSVLATRMLNVASSKADAVIVGMVLGPVDLGYYSIATRLMLALEQLFCQGVDAVALSAFSKVAGRPDDMAVLFQAATRTAAVLALPVFGGLALLAPDIVAAVLGSRWAGSAPVLQVLAWAGMLQAITHFNHAVFKASNQPERSARLAVRSALINVITLAAAAPFGILAVAGSYLLRCVLVAPVGLFWAMDIVQLRPRALFRPMLQPALALLAGGSLALLLRWLLAPYAPAWVLLLVCGSTGLVVYGVWLRLMAGQAWPFKRGQFSS